MVNQGPSWLGAPKWRGYDSEGQNRSFKCPRNRRDIRGDRWDRTHGHTHTHTSGCPAKILYVYCFSFPIEVLPEAEKVLSKKKDFMFERRDSCRTHASEAVLSVPKLLRK